MDYLEKYLSLGWKIIPLYPNSKRPMIKNWTNLKNYELSLHDVISRFNNINYGLVLGDIIDIECDNENSNNFINKAFKRLAHPIYISNKSYHHLFLNDDINFTFKKFGKIEIRCRHMQSVLPLSEVDGFKYTWITTNNFILPKINFKLINKIFHKDKNKKNNLILIRCPDCIQSFKMGKKKFNYEKSIFTKFKLSKWKCNSCRELELYKNGNKMLKDFSYYENEYISKVIEYNLDETESLVLYLCYLWIYYYKKIIPNNSFVRFSKKTNPTKSILFKTFYKLYQTTKDKIEYKQYKQYIQAQLYILKNINDSTKNGIIIDVNSVLGEKAWSRWKLWEKNLNQKIKNKEKLKENSGFNYNFYIDKINRSEEFFNRNINKFGEEQIVSKVNQWIKLNKIDPLFLFYNEKLKNLLDKKLISLDNYNEIEETYNTIKNYIKQ